MHLKYLCPLLLLASTTVYASDQCLSDAIEAGGASSAFVGSVVISTRASNGASDTRVIMEPQAPSVQTTDGFRIASITKTFVAATVLRLWEDGRIDLDAPIGPFLPKQWVLLLERGGYRPDQMTVRQLMSHTSGLADHAKTPQFIARIKTTPQREWSREIDIQDLIAWTKPVGRPGEKFSYSDTGYVLLGAIVERITGVSLSRAVRTELSLDRLHLPNTYWERYEASNGRRRAHQIFDGLDTYTWNPSMDLFGGGGIVSTPEDLATFFDALLTGRVFAHRKTLALMTSDVGLPPESPYRLGVFVYNFDGVTSVGHSGFWGTFVARETVSGQTIAAAVTNKDDYPKLKDILIDYLARAHRKGTAETCAEHEGRAVRVDLGP